MSRWVGRTPAFVSACGLGFLLGIVPRTLLTGFANSFGQCWQPPGYQVCQQYFCRAVFPDGLVHELGRQGWEQSSQELLLPLVTTSQPSWFPVAPSSVVLFLPSDFYEGSSGHSQSVNIPSKGNGGDCGAISSWTPPWLFV